MTATPERPLVLLSNDDGYRAQGLMLLRDALLTHFDVVVCAPDTEQSASSHALSLNRPLRLLQRGEGIFSVDGTPADSIYVALHAGHVLPRKPDLVVSGMNHGLNLGQDVFYSGTVAAAREGALQGYVALAMSAGEGADPASAAEMAAALAVATLAAGLTGPRLFNINFPRGKTWPLRATRLGKREYGGGLIRREDPRGLPYYWIGGSTVHHDSIVGSDTEAYDEGVVGVTPLVMDLWSSHLEDDAKRLVSALTDPTSEAEG
jgi:5'-nucleotidase